VIVLTKDTTNNFVCTLYELTTIQQNAGYLFEFISDQTKEKKTTVLTDISTNISRYNEFNLIENRVENPVNGQINLGSAGYFTYKVYEQLSSTNLDPTNELVVVGVVEEGKMKLIDTSYEPSYTEHSVSPTTNVVYNPRQ